jgi:hypothetical protein
MAENKLEMTPEQKAAKARAETPVEVKESVKPAAIVGAGKQASLAECLAKKNEAQKAERARQAKIEALRIKLEDEISKI